MKHKCMMCRDTGEFNQDGQLDCAAPGCDAAVERAAMNEFVESLKYATVQDVHWAIHQRAIELAEQKAAQSFANQSIVVSIPRRRKEDKPENNNVPY